MAKLEQIIEGVVTGGGDQSRSTSTPGNDAYPKEGSAPGKKNAPKAKGGVKPMPAVATDLEVKNKDAAKVAHQTNKAKEPQAAPKTGDKSHPTQGSSKETTPLQNEEEEFGYVEEDLEIPSTKAGMAKALFDILREMDRDDLEERFGDIIGAIINEDSDDDDEDEYEFEIDDESAEMVEAARTRIGADDIDISADVDALLSDDDENLSEEFKTNAKIIFEAAVVSKINEEIDRLEYDFKVELTEARTAYEEQLTEKVDGYLSYVVEEWMKENELAVESGIRSEITEDFLTGLKNLFTEHYITIPDEKVDVVDELAMKVEDLENALNESIENNIDLQQEANGRKQDHILNAFSDGLADTEIEKLGSLAEGVEYEDEDQYIHAITTLRESYFPQAPITVVEEDTDELLSESLTSAPRTSAAMSAYTQTLGRTIRR
jgi:hypothetical protein